MALFHFVNCVALCFLPHAVYYHATDMAEYDVLGSVMHGFACQLGTAFAKMVVLAFLLPGADAIHQDWAKDSAQMLVALMDVIGIWFALVSKFAHRNTSNAHKFQSVGVGWAFADSLLKRAAPLYLGAISPEFTYDHIQSAIRSNIVLIQSLSFAAVGTLLWNKKSKPQSLVPLLKLSLAVHALVPMAMSLAEQHLHIEGFIALGTELAISAACALTSWKLYSTCTSKRD
ncbi:unnamed protein product [Ostreobium quekettii]|uniref:BOS complex subunit TMEM147 n=1 Tax=Ostreobium quekettii TaxID=121088 RepID=A0A8S1J987_9CHLO|nr:unnamed protein product [Ostreobium quekettii]|eukprot:evm.model.scf_666.9 EVM.evm.TU.scf_666.9   scf_666:39723-42855(+)